MKEFTIEANRYLSRSTRAFYHTTYTGWKKLGNPDYLNHLKNTYNDEESQKKLPSATQKLRDVLERDLSQIFQLLGFERITVCVVPRAKAEGIYNASQQLFRSTVRSVIGQKEGLVDGTSFIYRHTNTKTTHFRKPIPNYINDGPLPYPGITEETCNVSPEVREANILLVDDIYTPNVNIDEDAVNALLNNGASTVTFYAVGRTLAH